VENEVIEGGRRSEERIVKNGVVENGELDCKL